MATRPVTGTLRGPYIPDENSPMVQTVASHEIHSSNAALSLFSTSIPITRGSQQLRGNFAAIHQLATPLSVELSEFSLFRERSERSN